VQIDNQFVADYNKWIIEGIRRMGIRDHDAIDEYRWLVYERLLSHNNYDETKGKVTTWLNSVVRSVVSNQAKKLSRSEDVLDQTDRLGLDDAGSYFGNEDAGDTRDEIDRILGAVVASKRDKDIFLEVMLAERGRKEVAEEFGVGVEVVNKVVTRTLSKAQAIANPTN